MTLNDTLKNKPLFYKAFDPLRMKKAFLSIKNRTTKAQIIHIVGTNGKGTTGRYLASMLKQASCRVGHYTSPHIQSFNERFWLNGRLLEDRELEAAFRALKTDIDEATLEALSYFELATFLAWYAFRGCDYLILEAGLGGEYDATAVFETMLTLVTPIGFDHQSFLGTRLEDIVKTKLNAIQKRALIAKQTDKAHAEIVAYKERMKKDIAFFKPFSLSYEDLLLCEAFFEQAGVDYLRDNFAFALWAFRTLGFDQVLDVEKIETLFGRMSLFRENVRLDVGHNQLAAERICRFYGNSKVNLVYNTLEDKDYISILKSLKPIVEHVYIIDIEDARAVNRLSLEQALRELGFEYEPFESIEAHKQYLVFGSFVVIESFLKRVHG